jgi:hypothetical protein
MIMESLFSSSSSSLSMIVQPESSFPKKEA